MATTSITRAPKGEPTAQAERINLDDGDMTDMGRVFDVIADRVEDLYIDLVAMKGGAQ